MLAVHASSADNRGKQVELGATFYVRRPGSVSYAFSLPRAAYADLGERRA